MINFYQPITIQVKNIDGVSVDAESTFNRLIQVGPGSYEMFFVVDNNGEEQATSNGVTTITQAQLDDFQALTSPDVV